MTLVKETPKYEDPKELSKVTKQGVRVISAMPTSRILAYVAYRHRVGLLALSTFVMAGYIAYDKVVKFFL